MKADRCQTDTDMDSKLAGSANNCYDSPVIVRTEVKNKVSNPSTKGHLMRVSLDGRMRAGGSEVEGGMQLAKAQDCATDSWSRLAPHQMDQLHAWCPLNDTYHAPLLCPTGFPQTYRRTIPLLSNWAHSY